MLRRLGYAGLSLSIDITSNRGTILRNATPERLHDLTAQNLAGLRAILEFNVAHGVYLFRMSSQIVPFASHPVHTAPWWEEFAAELAAIGALVRDYDLRVSMHPGQYNVLSSPDPRVVEATLADLSWHARLFDAMGLDSRHKLVIHGGGAYGDKPAAIARWARMHGELPDAIRRRLVLENDERIYSAVDVLETSARCGVPVVIDTFHHALHPERDRISLGAALDAAFTTWGVDDGPPKTHFSTQAPAKQVGAHSDYLDRDDFLAFLAVAPARPFDCMLECKAKDKALFQLRAQLAERGIIESDLQVSAPAAD